MKKAFTLIELLVYMAIMSFIIIVAGRAFSDSTSMRVRTQNMTKASEEVNKVAAILKEDISQMGAKSWKVNNTTDNFLIAKKVYYNLNATPQPDSSSYNLDKSNTNWHKFIFHKVHYKGDGTCGAVLKITWEVKPDSSLWRRCEQLDDSECPKSVSISKDECPDSLVMATGVEKFTLLPSNPVTSISLFGGPSTTGLPTFKLIDRGNQVNVKSLSSSSSINPEGNKVTISGFILNEPSGNFLNQVLVGAPNTNNCKGLTFKKDTVYAIQFKTPIKTDADNVPDDMAFFKPGSDHIAVVLVKPTDLDIVSKRFIFWPPQATNSNEHYMEFSLPAAQETCVAFEFSFYKPNSIAYKGALIIEDFEVIQKNDKAYNFDNVNYAPPTVADKKNVKAFKLDLKVKRKSEIGGIEGMVIPTPNNGIKATATEAPL